MGYNRGAAQCDVNRPSTIHTVKSKSLEKQKVMNYVDGFLDAYDNIISSCAVSGDSKQTVNGYLGPKSIKISQLKRLQRELRGLPPVIMDEQTINNSVESVPSVRKNKKIIFDDDTPKYVPDEEDNDQPEKMGDSGKDSGRDSSDDSSKDSDDSSKDSDDSDKDTNDDSDDESNDDSNDDILLSKRKAEEDGHRKHKKHHHKHKSKKADHDDTE
ncbi:hypothetical protein FOA43_001939 [Brettanomyces nanus]|uniref:Uncharacterized protein n=1 Tax=Eeniella nana TaxID=13502 RepID=A0A875RUI6_EENNA|nr:uncharacterized protein FOA43_001939 [Brettanomyces nanus]QPG74607.1 hypothetical protein FOA43_001939 [Brettanomyces nanus]